MYIYEVLKVCIVVLELKLLELSNFYRNYLSILYFFLQNNACHTYQIQEIVKNQNVLAPDSIFHFK